MSSPSTQTSGAEQCPQSISPPQPSSALPQSCPSSLQVFGSHGVATDLPIAQWYADARAARIYDGASEVHRMVIARDMLKLAPS